MEPKIIRLNAPKQTFMFADDIPYTQENKHLLLGSGMRKKKGGVFNPANKQKLALNLNDPDVLDATEKEEKLKQFTKLHKLDDSHVYYNITITNTSLTGEIKATFQEFRGEAIIENPEDYHLSVIRFTIPTATIPLLIPSIQPGPPPFGSNTDPLLTNYSFTLSYYSDDGTTVPAENEQVYLRFVPQNIDALSPDQWDNSGVIANEAFYAIYSYQNFIQMWNDALSNCFFALSSTAQDSGIIPPKFIFDPVTQLISLIVHKNYAVPDDPTVGYIHIFSNKLMSGFLQAFNTIYYDEDPIDGMTALIVIDSDDSNKYIRASGPISITTASNTTITSSALFTRDMLGGIITAQGIPLNTTMTALASTSSATISTAATASATINATISNNNYLKISQQSINLSAIDSIRSIIFTTGSVPIKSEYTPTISKDSTTTSNFLPILTDFEPELPSQGFDRSVLTYLPTAEYRLVDMKGNIPLQKFDLTIFWQDRLLNRYPLYLLPQQSIDIKILFRKKSVVK